MEQLFLNNILVDIIPNTISQTKQFNTVADMGSRQASYTNSFKLPYTPRNIQVLDALGIIGNVSRKPYQKINAHLKIGGISLITDGFAKIIETNNDGCKIVIYSGIIKIKELISEESIQTLDFSYLTTGNIEPVGNASNSSRFCYPFGDLFDRITNNTNTPTLTLSSLGFIIQQNSQQDKVIQPALYVKDLFLQILNESGLNATGEFLNDNSFKTEIINLRKPFPLSGSTNEIGDYLHDQTRWDFVKDIVNRYGLIIELKNNNIRFIKLENILSGNNGFDDWSDKFNSLIKSSYEPKSVGQTNTVEIQTESNHFTLTDIENNNSSIIQSDVIETHIANFSFNESINIDNNHIPINKKLFKWSFVKPAYKTKLSPSAQAVIYLDNLAFIPYYRVIQDGVGNVLNDWSPLDVEKRLFKVFESPYSVSYYGYSSISTNLYYDERYVDPNWYLNKYYNSYFKMMNRFHQVEVYMNLGLLDVQKLHFYKLKYIKQLGGYFYLNKVKDWQEGKLTKVELVKVYPKMTQAPLQINNQGLGSALEMNLG